jgi:regulator of sigma D
MTHRAAFQPATSAKEVYDNIECDDNELRHLTLIQNIREKMWERVVSEDQMIPNANKAFCRKQSKKVFLPQP